MDAREQFPALATLEDGPFSALLGLRVEAAKVCEVMVRMPFDRRTRNYGPSEYSVNRDRPPLATLGSGTNQLLVSPLKAWKAADYGHPAAAA
jgi:hypothetical protein